MNVNMIPEVRVQRRMEATRRTKIGIEPDPGAAESPISHGKQNGNRAPDPGAAESPQSQIVRRQRDTVILSGGADSGGDMETGGADAKKLQDIAAAQTQIAHLRENLKTQSEQWEQYIKAAAQDAKNLRIALEIARRIASGGHVPRQDEQWLMQYSPEMYFNAKMQAMRAEENNEEYDSLLESEEDETNAQRGGLSNISGAAPSGGESGAAETEILSAGGVSSPAESVSASV